ncbi:MAG TPA: hypothetical protein VI636_16950 [Candidatus Angelobacter sp.]
MRRYLTAVALGISLLAPSAITAQEHDRDRDRPKHEWSDQEKDHWHQYLNEHHKKDHDWEKASKREQKAYWKWRDAHPDHQDQDHH